MTPKLNTFRRRTVAAYDVLCGRPPKPDYGLLIVLPLVASAGGALIGLGVDIVMSRRFAARRASMDSARTAAVTSASSSGRRGA